MPSMGSTTKFVVKSREMWCIAKEDTLGIVLVVQPEGSYFWDVPQIAAFHNKLREGLHLNKMSINSTLVQKLLMSTLLSNATLVDDIYAVSIIYGAETVCYDY